MIGRRGFLRALGAVVVGLSLDFPTLVPVALPPAATIDINAELIKIYDRVAFFEPCEREGTRFWDDIEDDTPVALKYRTVGAAGKLPWER